jgi:hypothetical protein
MKFMKVISVSLILMLLFVSAASAAQGETKVKTNANLCADRLIELQTKQSVHVEKAAAKSQNEKNLYKHEIVDINEQITVSASLDSSTLVCGKSADGSVRIKDLGKDHKLRDIRIKASDLTGLPGVDKGIVKITHFNDAGLPDAVWVQEIVNNGGYVYFEGMPFSEVIIGGFIGTYEKSGTVTYQTSTSFALGSTFEAESVNFLNAVVTPVYEEDSPYDIPTDGLVGWWKFDENTSTNVSDSSGNGNHGTATGMTWTDGKYNGAGSFDGVNGYCKMTSVDELAFNESNFTIIFSYDSQSTLSSYFLAYNTYTDADKWAISRYTTYVKMRWEDIKGFGTQAFDVKGKHTIVFMRSGNDGYAYVDNTVKYAPNAFIGKNFSAVSDLYVAVRNGLVGFNAVDIDNVMFYNRALSDAEIKQIYYDSLVDLQLKTNSNAEYSTAIDSGTVAIPYDSTDADITSLTAYVPENVTIGGVTVRDYQNTVTPFEVVAEVGYTEDTTLIAETLTDESYQLVIRHTPGNDYTAASTVVYTSETNSILSSSYLTYDFTSTNPNAVLVFNPTTLKWTITTGAITEGTTYTYNIIATTEGTEVLDVVDGVGDSFVETYPNAGNETTAIGTSFTVTSTSEFVGIVNGSDIWNSTSALILVIIVLGGVGLIFTYFRKVD